MKMIRTKRGAVGVILMFSAFLPNLKAADDNAIRSLKTDKHGMTFQTGSRLMRVEVCSPTVVHVTVSPTDRIPSQLVPVVIHTWPEVAFHTNQTAAALEIVTTALRVSIDRATATVSYFDLAGRPVLRELPDRSIEPKIIQNEKTWQVAQSFDSPDTESLYGLGQHQEGWLDLRGIPLRLRQVNTQIAVPLVLSSRGFGLLWNNPSITEFNPVSETIPVDPKTGVGEFTTGEAGDYGFLVQSDVHDRLSLSINGTSVVDLKNMWVPYSASGTLKLPAHQHCRIIAGGGPSGVTVYVRSPSPTTRFQSEAGRAIDYYFFYGSNLNAVISDYRLATGEAPLFPRWALGFWQCRERYSSQQQLLDVAKEFREKNIPMDVIVQDWQYWGKFGFNALKFDDHYPQPSAMTEDLHAHGEHLAITVWSKLGRDTELFREFHQRSLLLPDGPPDAGWIDMFNPAARKLLWQSMTAHLFKDGIDAWWLDATEPEFDPLAGQKTFMGPGEFVHDAYPLYVTQAVYDGQRAATNNKRVVILTRSSFAGQQRNAAASWSGDINGNWETLRKQIPAGLNFSMSGLPYWTTDVGGFFRPPDQYTSDAYHELLIRWFEFGSFCPLFRVHGWQSETEMWKFGQTTEAALRKYDELRYRLLPYIYSSAWAVTHSGATMMRALPMDYREDAKAAAITDQFLFGPELLVNPVTEAGATSRNLYLPGTASWIDFWTGKSESGGQSVHAEAPLDVIPLYLRAGSILPLGAPIENASQSSDPLEIRVYEGADGAFELYEDEGDTYDYEKGAYSTILFSWNEKQRLLSIGKRSGEFPGMLKQRKFHVVWVRPGAGAGSFIDYTGQEIQVLDPH